MKLNRYTFLYTAAFLLPAIFLILQVPNVSYVPILDYWQDFVEPMYIHDTGFFPKTLLYKSNEHYIVLPMALHYVNAIVTQGSNTGQYLINILLSTFIVLTLFKLFTKSLEIKSNVSKVSLLFLVTFFVFAPIASHNWAVSMSGIAWFSANLLFLLSIFVFFRYFYSKETWGSFLLLLAISLLAMFSYSTGLLTGAVIALIILLDVLLSSIISRQRPKLVNIGKSILLVIAFAIFYIWRFVFDYSTPDHHPEVGKDVYNSIKYSLSFLSSAITQNTNYSYYYSFFAILLVLGIFVFFLYKNLKKNDSEYAFFNKIMPFTILLYTILSSLMAGVTRSGFGFSSSVSSRYINISLLFWLSVVVIIGVFLNEYLSNKNIKNNYLAEKITPILVVIVVLVFVVPLHIKGRQEFEKRNHIFSEHRLFDISLELGIEDTSLAKVFVPTHKYSELKELDVREINQVPFNKRLLDQRLFRDKYNIDEFMNLDTEKEILFNLARELGDTGYSLISLNFNLYDGLDYSQMSIYSHSSLELVGGLFSEQFLFNNGNNNLLVGYLRNNISDVLIDLRVKKTGEIKTFRISFNPIAD